MGRQGLEPSILAAADFKSAVYTNSTTQPIAITKILALLIRWYLPTLLLVNRQ